MYPRLVSLAIICCFIAACSTTGSHALSVVASATNVTYYYENGQAVEFIDNADLTDDEVVIVLESLEQIDKSKRMLKPYRDNPALLIRDIDNVQYEYSKIKDAYIDIRYIVLDNKDEYNSYEWDTFMKFDTSVIVLDEQFDQLIESTKSGAAVSTAMTFADTAIKLAAIL